MDELIEILNNNNVKYLISDYVGIPCILIKKNHYQIEIFKDNKGYVSDLQNIPFTWGVMGSTTIEEIIKDLKKYFNINLFNVQLKLF